MRRSLALVVFLIAGCGTSDPSTSRLAAGTKVMVPQGTVALLVKLDGSEFPDDAFGRGFNSLFAGDEASVQDDPSGDNRRLVRIIVTKQIPQEHIATSRLVGLECRTRRKDLRPIP